MSQEDGTTSEPTIAPGNFRISAAGRAFIKHKEGFEPRAYLDGGGYSIGWGHHIQPGEQHLRNATLSEREGENLFDRDIAIAEAALNQNIHVPLTQKQVDAMGSLTYNIGGGALEKSQVTLAANRGDFQSASRAFGRHITSEGKRNQVLVDRRGEEAGIFNGGDYGSGARAELDFSGSGSGSGDRGLATRAGEFFGNAGSMLSNWFRDDETGEFSAKKALMSAGALALLAYTAMNGNTWLFIATLVFMLVAGAVVMGGGMHFENPHAPRTPDGRKRERQRGREREIEEEWQVPGTIRTHGEMPEVDPSVTEPLRGSAPEEIRTHNGAPAMVVRSPQEGVWRAPPLP